MDDVRVERSRNNGENAYGHLTGRSSPWSDRALDVSARGAGAGDMGRSGSLTT